jgi:HEAT repeat protein
VRNAAAVALASFGSPSEEFTLALRQASQSDNGQARKAAAAAFELLENNKARSNR